MASINKVILIGHLGSDPELRYMPNGDAIVTISIATTDKWKDRNSGETKEKTEWHRVKFFRKLAEIVDKYLSKGSQIYVEGKLRTQKWTDKQGTDRYITEVIALDMKMLSSKQTDNNQSNAPTQPSPDQQGGFEDMEDDIPF